ncbi:MAG: TRAP transporter large permease [Deltaproteobacteria bacterium]|nr:TRAP transporter large permease [Deltaproteobacteria bacterium]
MDSFALLAIPLFILLSAPIAASRAAGDLYEAIHRWLYKLPGGLGISSMLACGVFAALCGSSPATAAAIGGIGIPEMRRRGYPPSLACGLIAHAGTFGILIPPSITMILYGIATETSIGKCFIAGILPGLLEILLSCIWVVFYFRYSKAGQTIKASQAAAFKAGLKAGEEAVEHYTLKEQLAYLPRVLPFILIIVGIMGSLYGGWATPSEAAGVGAVMSLVLVMVIYRMFRLTDLKTILVRALSDSTMILMIMAAALLFSFVCSDLYVTQSLAELILALPLGKWGIVIVINILLLILGFFIPPAAVILMVGPLLLPVIKGLGFDPVWFAVIMTVNLEIGLVTPPVGLNLYIVKGIAPDVPLSQVLWGVVPFVIIEGIVIAAVCAWPELALWLPNKMIG